MGGDERPYLLTVGRLVPEKAAIDLVHAFASVSGDHRLLIVGGASGSSGYEQQLRGAAAADDRVVLTGAVFGEDLATLYRNADGFVMPSHLEGLPLSVLEAASHALPLICSNIEPHVEILEADGPGRRLFQWGDVTDLGRVLKRFLHDIEGERFGTLEAQETVLRRYSWDQAARSLEALYDRLLGS